jgi:hypothetical protein
MTIPIIGCREVIEEHLKRLNEPEAFLTSIHCSYSCRINGFFKDKKLIVIPLFHVLSVMVLFMVLEDMHIL